MFNPFFCAAPSPLSLDSSLFLYSHVVLSGITVSHTTSMVPTPAKSMRLGTLPCAPVSRRHTFVRLLSCRRFLEKCCIPTSQTVSYFILFFGQWHIAISDSLISLSSSSYSVKASSKRSRAASQPDQHSDLFLTAAACCTRLLSVFSSVSRKFSFMFQASSVLSIVFFIVDSKLSFFPAAVWCRFP